MPVYSMTGYATGHSEASAATPTQTPVLGLEIRSVNSRFLDLSLRLSDELRSAEPLVRDQLTQRLRRGKVEVRAWIEGRQDAALRTPSAHELRQLLATQDQVRAWHPQARELSVAEIVGLLARSSVPAAAETEQLPVLLDRVLTDFSASRAREGARLVSMLLDRTAQLRQLAPQAAPMVPRLVEQQRMRFLERWNEALGAAAMEGATALAQERALAEATAFAIRIDVAEELTRLQSHLDEIDRLLHQGGEVGKRLDFLIQELHREANTLGSKSSSLELTRISVDMKVLIEQMREQVQNLE